MSDVVLQADEIEPRIAEVLRHIRRGDHISIAEEGRVIACIVPQMAAVDLDPLQVLLDEGPRFDEDWPAAPRTIRPLRDLGL